MPPHQVDLNVGKALGRFDLRLALRAVLGQKVEYKQFEQTPRGEVQQITRSFRPGRTFSVSLTYKI